LPIAAAAPISPSSSSLSASASLSTLRLLSWNLLAPPYKRLEHRREEAAADEWRPRALAQITLVAQASPDIIGLQEFWSANDGFVRLWKEFANEHGYVMHVVPRVDGKADGCCLLVRLPPSRCTFSAFTFDDWGSRILQMAQLRVSDSTPPLVLMQTHLTFPHASEHDPPMRYQQARKIVELCRADPPVSTCVFGDLNGDQDDPAVAFLTSSGGLRPMPPPTRAEGVACDAADSTGPHMHWLTHVAHNGARMACDLILTRGDCCVREWTLGGSESALIGGSFTSDHLPVIATLSLDRTEIAQIDASAARRQSEPPAEGRGAAL
jgi:endonuclease/exonuclease/phosphatase family metal-dependent hydrolase